MRQFLVLSAAALLAACSPPRTEKSAPETAAVAPPTRIDIPAGRYVEDAAHTSLVFRVSHMGYSNYTARFTGVKVRLDLDPANPAAARLEADIDPKTIAADNAPAGFMDTLRGKDWLDAAAHPLITYRSTAVTPTGPTTARVDGTLTIRGVSRPMALDVTFNGGYPGFSMDPQARAGFSATGKLRRSEYGVTTGLPPPGSNLGVFDEIDVVIETELLGPPLAPAT